MPWRPRPAIIGSTEEVSAQITEPSSSGAQQASSIRRLPKRSPRRPLIGTNTAAESRVAVITQEAFEGEVSRIFGSSPISGVTRVCMIAATVPVRARVATTPRVRSGAVVCGAAMGGGSSVPGQEVRSCAEYT